MACIVNLAAYVSQIEAGQEIAEQRPENQPVETELISLEEAIWNGRKKGVLSSLKNIFPDDSSVIYSIRACSVNGYIPEAERERCQSALGDRIPELNKQFGDKFEFTVVPVMSGTRYGIEATRKAVNRKEAEERELKGHWIIDMHTKERMEVAV